MFCKHSVFPCINSNFLYFLHRRQDKEFWMSVFDRLLNVADCNDHTVLDGIIRDFEIRLADPTKRSWFDGALKIQVAMS